MTPGQSDVMGTAWLFLQRAVTKAKGNIALSAGKNGRHDWRYMMFPVAAGDKSE
ncbi:MAG: hypothetical protein PHH77_11385 [Victivallaceae bacterium]|nr:hypothetical protein [Victivallaceae bacterium]